MMIYSFDIDLACMLFISGVIVIENRNGRPLRLSDRNKLSN